MTVPRRPKLVWGAAATAALLVVAAAWWPDADDGSSTEAVAGGGAAPAATRGGWPDDHATRHAIAAPRSSAASTTVSTSSVPESTTSTAPPSTAVEPPPDAAASSATSPPTTPPAPPPPPTYHSSIETVSAEQLGSSWSPGMGCPGPDSLRAVVVDHWGYDGAVHQGRIIVAADRAEDVAAIFGQLFADRFPIQRMVPVDAYGGDDQASMRANNTSGFNCRYVAGTTRLSQHGLGLAIDVNPLVNPYVKGASVDPPEGAKYADRSRTDPGMIHAGDATVRAFAARGWRWGGDWSSGRDYQHFSPSGT